MSLNVALNIATSGLNVIEKQISVTANNITNANTAGYTTESYDATYASGGVGTIAVGGEVQGSIDQFLTQSLVDQNSDYGLKNIISSYISSYDESIGSTDTSNTTLESALDDFESAVSSLNGATTDASTAGATVVSDAESVAAQLNSLSSNLQQSRLQANQQISTNITTVNSTLDDIASLNRQISDASSGQNTANLEDQRVQDLQTLSGLMGIQYFTDGNNQVQVYTSGGQQLVSGATDSHLSYIAAGSVSSSTTYPGGFSGIMLQGQDITSSITSGEIGGLIQLRDTTLPNEQAKLDALATTVMDTANTIVNQGASIPPRNSMTGSTTVASSDSFSATGDVRIAITNSTGTVVSTTDLDLSSYATVGDLVTALNGLSGVSASIDSNGNLEISSTNSSDGVSINEMTSSVGSDNEGFSSYFGLNNLFDGTDASDIKVSDYLQQDADYLATGSLSNSATLAAGDTGIAAGDVSIATALSNALTGQVSFAAAGGFAAQSNTITGYASSIVAGVATAASDASSSSTTSQSLLASLQDTISGESGVDIDQQTANATMLQNSYSATAQLMSTIQSMYTALLNAVGG